MEFLLNVFCKKISKKICIAMKIAVIDLHGPKTRIIMNVTFYTYSKQNMLVPPRICCYNQIQNHFFVQVRTHRCGIN